MSAASMHPPADTRCQIYVPSDPMDEKALLRCEQQGTHWVKWAGCSCITEDQDSDCMEDFYSWECESHDPTEKGLAA